MKYILHWLNGQTQEVYGNNIADAMTKAGYGAGVAEALDYYEEVSVVSNLCMETAGAIPVPGSNGRIA